MVHNDAQGLHEASRTCCIGSMSLSYVVSKSPVTEEAARAEPSLLELCRVASEEDEVNNQKSLGEDEL